MLFSLTKALFGMLGNKNDMEHGERKTPQPFWGECSRGTFCKVFKNYVLNQIDVLFKRSWALAHFS